MSKKILIIVHQPTSTPGRVGIKLRNRGYELDIRRPCLDEQLPETMQDHAGAIIFGGPMSANDDQALPYLRREIDWIGVPLKENARLLGICLGAQLMARHLGAEVAPHPAGYAEVGYYPIYPEPHMSDLFDWPDFVYQWHEDGFDLPAGAQRIIRGPQEFPNQGMKLGENAYGIQFHPEVNLAMMHRWVVKGAYRFALPGTQNAAEHFAGRMLHDGAIERWLDQFLDHWLA